MSSSGRSDKKTSITQKIPALKALKIFLVVLLLIIACIVVLPEALAIKYDSAAKTTDQTVAAVTPPPAIIAPVLDIAAYDKKMLELANIPPPKVVAITVPPVVNALPAAAATAGTGSTPLAVVKVPTPVPPPQLWPAKTVYPNAGAILPFNRIVAYYGNFYSKAMGVLGEYPPLEMLEKLNVEVDKWKLADPSTPVIPAIDYIAVTAQGSPGADGKYILRMPDSQIQEAITLAKQVNGLVFLEIQPGGSTMETEVPLLAQYLKMPNVELALDPEFAMHNGAKPGTVIGSIDATDVNFAANYLATLVKADNLPPKILVVHRFTLDMVTNVSQIKPLPEVEIVMDMDGWGPPAKKIGTYNEVIYPQPVQFTGFKLFYKNDLLPPSTAMLTPADLLKLSPQPIFIQYQ